MTNAFQPNFACLLQDAINSASSITQSFTAELVDGQRKFLALVAAGNTKALNPIAVQTNNGLIAARPEMVLIGFRFFLFPLLIH